MSDTLDDLDDVYKVLIEIASRLRDIDNRLGSLMSGTHLSDLRNVLKEISKNTRG